MDEYTSNDRRTGAHIERMLAEIQASIGCLHKAFPDGDIDGHRKYHEAKIRAAQAEEIFWTDLKLDIAKKGAWGIIIVLVGLFMLGLSVKLGIGGSVK